MAASNNHRLTVTVKPNSGHTLFRYTAKDIDGKVVRGAMEAADYDTLYTQLLAQGLYLQSATRRGAGRSTSPAAAQTAARARSARRSSATCAASFPRCSPRASVWCAR